MAEKAKTISVREFLSWLSGVEEMQDEGWTPTSTQWKRIRDKINLIDDAPSNARPLAQDANDDGRYAQHNAAPVVYSAPALGAPVYQPSGGMPDPVRDLAGRPFLPEHTNVPARTPSIDTSNGNYQSAFA